MKSKTCFPGKENEEDEKDINVSPLIVQEKAENPKIVSFVIEECE